MGSEYAPLPTGCVRSSTRVGGCKCNFCVRHAKFQLQKFRSVLQKRIVLGKRERERERESKRGFAEKVSC